MGKAGGHMLGEELSKDTYLFSLFLGLADSSEGAD